MENRWTLYNIYQDFPQITKIITIEEISSRAFILKLVSKDVFVVSSNVFVSVMMWQDVKLDVKAVADPGG